MKTFLLTVALLFITLPAFAEENTDAIIQKELDAMQTIDMDKRIEINQRLRDKNNYMADNYSAPQLETIINNEQNMKARIARREGKAEPTKINVDTNNTAAVKRYFELSVPDDKIDEIE
ncbi:MAG: hypothetical protein LBL47_01505 [Lactobacillus sp.]|jgi:hypothetical protein|nr:hypothetical protein [Lactobacillus sp.]